MELNHYNLYSTLSESNTKNSDEYSLLLEQALELTKLKDLDDVKFFLENNWEVSGSVKNYFLADDCILNIEDSNEAYSIVVVCKNNNIIWKYKK